MTFWRRQQRPLPRASFLQRKEAGQRPGHRRSRWDARPPEEPGRRSAALLGEGVSLPGSNRCQTYEATWQPSVTQCPAPPPPAGEGGPRRPWRRASPRALTGGPGFPSTLFLCLATSTGHFITFLPNGRNLHRSRLCPGKLGVGVRGEQPHGLPVSVRKEAPHAATLPYPPVQRRGGGQRP